MIPVNITNVSVGMILAKPVIDDKGRTLCGSGTILTEKMIQRFDKMGVSLLYVESNEKINEEEYLRLINDVNKTYIKITENNMLQSIKKILLKHIESKKETPNE